MSARPRPQPAATDTDPAARVRVVEPDERQRARLRWFLAAHLAAVLAIYVTAVTVGGGLASPPFPPDLPHRNATAAQPASGDTRPAAAAAARQVASDWPSAPDVSAPWHHGGSAARD